MAVPTVSEAREEDALSNAGFARYRTKMLMMGRLAKGGYLHSYRIEDSQRREDGSETLPRTVGVMSAFKIKAGEPEKRTYRIGDDEHHYNSAAEWVAEYEKRLAAGTAP